MPEAYSLSKLFTGEILKIFKIQKKKTKSKNLPLHSPSPQYNKVPALDNSQENANRTFKQQIIPMAFYVF